MVGDLDWSRHTCLLPQRLLICFRQPTRMCGCSAWHHLRGWSIGIPVGFLLYAGSNPLWKTETAQIIRVALSGDGVTMRNSMKHLNSTQPSSTSAMSKSCATAGRYREETLELLHEDRIDRDTLIYAVHEVTEWLNQVKKLSF